MIIFRKITCLILLLFLAHMVQAQKSKEKQVIQAFENYKNSILSDQGEEAVKYVDSRTIQYYAWVLEQVKTSDSATVSALSILDRLMVFSVRHRTTKEEIRQFNGTTLLVYAIQQGMVGKNSVAHNTIGDVSIEGDFAKGQLIANKQKTPLYFHFYREEGNWKMDLTSLFPVSRAGLEKMAEGSGQDENEYLFYLLQLLTGRKPGPEIWKPTS